MMCIISKTIYLSSVFSLVYPVASFALFNPAYASLVDTSQNQTFESRPANSIKLAAVHFITNDNALNFGNQEFLPGDLCKQGGYSHEGCPSGYIKGEACPYDSKFVKDCIDPDTWCRNNGYNVTSCSVPKYLTTVCPYKSMLYKSCETDNIRACKELGYSLTCDTGKVGDSAQTCPYNSSYKKCICNPCSGYDYTAAQASAQGYVPGEVCNSCGTMKYKRSENACSGYKTCDCGGETGAKVCYSGSVQKFDTCKTCCDAKYQYDSSNCTGGKVLAGNSCGGKYESCTQIVKILYGDGTVSEQILAGKTPIGIVFDETNRLAVSLINIKKDGTPGTEIINRGAGECITANECIIWSTSEYDTPLTNCVIEYDTYEEAEEYTANQVAKCAPDGRSNTATLLKQNNGAPYISAQAVNKYQPRGCAGSFCSKGNWFLPSVRDYVNIYKNLTAINGLLNQLETFGAKPLINTYWTSNEITEYYAVCFVFAANDHPGRAARSGRTQGYSASYVRAAIKY